MAGWWRILGIGLGLAGCGIRPGVATPDGGGTIITAEQIARLDAHNALEVLERSPSYVSVRVGSGTVVLSRRGEDPSALGGRMLVFVDAVPLEDPIQLRDVPAASISAIRLLDETEGTLRYGAAGGAGVMIVETSARQARGQR